MATVDSLASEMFKMNAEMQQLRAHADQQAAIQAATTSQQTNKNDVAGRRVEVALCERGNRYSTDQH